MYICSVIVYVIDNSTKLNRTTNILNMSTRKPKIEKIASPAATLRGMRRGMVMMVPNRDIKASSLRAAASRLRKYGYAFTVNEKGFINEAQVICTKSPRS